MPLPVPNEILHKILLRLPLASIPRVALTCRRLNAIISSEVYWQDRAQADYRLPRCAAFRRAGWRQLYKRLRDPVVLNWGDPGNSRLGRRVARDNRRPVEVDALRGRRVVAVWVMGWGMAALTAIGEVLWWGTFSERWGPIALRPTALALTPGVRVAQMETGRQYLVCRTHDGKVIFFSATRDGIVPMHVPLPASDPITHIAASWHHFLAVGTSGAVYSAPANAEMAIVPHAVDGDPFVTVAGCQGLSIAISARGDVYTWAENGESGPPILHPDFSGRGFVYLSGSLHAFHLYSTAGDVVFIKHNNGVLSDITPASLKPIKGVAPVIQSESGDWHHGALREDGTLWMWGADSNGALGISLSGNARHIDEPTQVREGLENLFVFQIALGGWHSAALAVRIEDGAVPDGGQPPQ
ncbi:regulator of chromosome condensation 1/beta-lactamase-inhibitor protein II [Blyttiomyces helicus]|uniref:Regulator of chromosome condensation 1/beta-lactamase-inhibitor protein II n=1 Tax=Blyttiomyces helicus TaxID=388810 RepID=A0A4P9WPK0_9FUNG|nr:regulator of chromosome condensation 1/beta-lactamase-inhibitor protein II [Blyttiomyces helicus]|eukprot:RKO92736.1 regulator of chromosome condensation 1/beta-lactamase-inhibitor protein II [Blyttiomyces helicus]